MEEINQLNQEYHCTALQKFGGAEIYFATKGQDVAAGRCSHAACLPCLNWCFSVQMVYMSHADSSENKAMLLALFSRGPASPVDTHSPLEWEQRPDKETLDDI